MVYRKLLASAAALACAAGLTAFGTHAMAFGVVSYVEDPAGGWVGAIPTSSPAITVGSDGESSFDPFGAGYDTSDGIELNGNWAPDPAFANSFGAGHWTQLPGTNTWVLPACNATGCENANISEPIGRWDFIGGGQWGAGTESIVLRDADGSFSDLIKVANDGPNGGATITFISDGAPEPSTWAMMLLGVGLIGGGLRMGRRKQAVAVAA